MADLRISQLSSATPASTALFAAVVNSTTVKVTAQDIANATQQSSIVVGVQVFGTTVAVSSGDGKAFLHIPPKLNGYNLTYIHGTFNSTVGFSSQIAVAVYNVTQAASMLSSHLEFDAGELATHTAASAVLIDTANDDVATNDLLRFDVSTGVASSAPLGLLVTLGFGLP